MVANADEIGDLALEWNGLKSLVIYVASLRVNKDEAPAAIVKFYISAAELDAKSLLTAVCEQRIVENNFHWQLDGVPQAHRFAA